jgi:nicotinamide riboside kinase
MIDTDLRSNSTWSKILINKLDQKMPTMFCRRYLYQFNWNLILSLDRNYPWQTYANLPQDMGGPQKWKKLNERKRTQGYPGPRG